MTDGPTKDWLYKKPTNRSTNRRTWVIKESYNSNNFLSIIQLLIRRLLLFYKKNLFFTSKLTVSSKNGSLVDTFSPVFFFLTSRPLWLNSNSFMYGSTTTTAACTGIQQQQLHVRVYNSNSFMYLTVGVLRYNCLGNKGGNVKMNCWCVTMLQIWRDGRTM